MRTPGIAEVFVLAGLSTAGCATVPAPVSNSDLHGAGSLALTVRYTTLCATPISNDTCLSISYPQVCWSGTCTGNCSGEGARSFSVCAPSGTRTDDPFSIEQSAATSRLMPGSWEVHAVSPMWKLDCATKVLPGKTSFAVIDSAQESCI